MEKFRKAVYAASLDPITNGHLNVIERMAPLYDELVVMVADDFRKSYTFTAKERVDMAKIATAHLDGVSVDLCSGGYVVKKASKLGASVIIRGLRDFTVAVEIHRSLASSSRRFRAACGRQSRSPS